MFQSRYSKRNRVGGAEYIIDSKDKSVESGNSVVGVMSGIAKKDKKGMVVGKIALKNLVSSTNEQPQPYEQTCDNVGRGVCYTMRTPYISYARKVSGMLCGFCPTESISISFVQNKENPASSTIPNSEVKQEVDLMDQYLRESIESMRHALSPSCNYQQGVVTGLIGLNLENSDLSFVGSEESSKTNIVSENELEQEVGLMDQYLRESMESMRHALSPSYNYQQEVVTGLVGLNLENSDLSFIGGEESFETNIVSENELEQEVDLMDQYLREGMESVKHSLSLSCNYQQEVVTGLVGLNLENSDLSFVGDEESFETNIVSGSELEHEQGVDSMDQYLKENMESTMTNVAPTSCVSYEQGVLTGLVGFSLENSNLSSVGSEGNSKASAALKDELEEGVDLDDQYLRENIVSVTNSASSNVDYTQKVLTKIRSSEKEHMSSVENEESSRPVSIVSDSHVASVKYRSAVSSGLTFQVGVKYNESELYKKVSIDFCNKLKAFKKLHSSYCINLARRTFIAKDDKLIIPKNIRNLFSKLTPHTEILFFVLKVFLLINFSAICGGRNLIDNIRYGSKHFYDQSLLNLLLSRIIVTTSEKRGSKIKEIFLTNCSHLRKVNYYDPHSSEFFQIVFDICSNLASVELYNERKKELVDFAMLACMVYCGHMVGNLYMALNYEKEESEKFHIYLNARGFCKRCHNLKNVMVHMYHPVDENVSVSNVGGVIDVPQIVWRNCSRKIHETVKKSIAQQNNITFGMFVENMIRPIKRLVLLPETRHYYKSDIKMYADQIKKVPTLLPLLGKKFPYHQVNHTHTESLNL